MAKGNQRDYYEVLGVTRTDAVEEIKSAYRKAALKWHPDRNPENKSEAEVKFRECTEAYSVLSDAQKRQIYDTYGHAGLSSAGASQGFFSTIFQDFHDIFGDFFGFEDLFGATLLAATPAASPAAEQILEHEKIAKDVVKILKDGAVEARLHARAGEPGVAVAVVDFAFLRVAQHAVGFGRLAESLLGFLFVFRIAVRMPLERGFAVRRFDLIY